MEMQNQTDRRTFLKGALSTATGITAAQLLQACSSDPTKSVTLDYWDWYISQAQWVDSEIALFQKAHPDIKIRKKTIDNGTYTTAMKSAVRNHTLPDVFMLPDNPSLYEQVTNGWLLPLDKWASTSWQSHFPRQSFYEGNNVFKGKLYTAPFDGGAPNYQLYINEDVFKNAGLTNSDGSVALPNTWDDVTHAAETIVKKSNGSIYGFGFGNGAFNLLRWWLEVFVRGAGSPGGGYGADLRSGRYTYSTDRNYHDFISLWLDWKKRGYFYPNSPSINDQQARAFFEVGKFGMTVGGVWSQPAWEQHHFSNYSLTTLVSPQATKAGYFYYQPGGKFIGISGQTKHADAAWAWFDWLYSRDAGKRWVQLNEGLSVYPQNNDPERIRSRNFAQFANIRIYAFRGPNPVIRNPQTAYVIIPTTKPHIGDIMASLFTGKLQDLSSALSDTAARTQHTLETSIKTAQQKGYKVSIADYTYPDWDITQPYYTEPAAQEA